MLISSQALLSPSSSFLHLLPILSLTFCYCSEEWDSRFPMTMMRLGTGKHILITLFSVFSLLIDIEAAQAKQPACEPGVCSRRLMQYMYHQRHRPSVSCFFGFLGVSCRYICKGNLRHTIHMKVLHRRQPPMNKHGTAWVNWGTTLVHSLAGNNM